MLHITVFTTISVTLLGYATTQEANCDMGILCNVAAQVTSLTSSASTCRCGCNPNRIVGGEEEGGNEYYMMAGLVDTSNKEIYCGAAVIDKNYVLTGAHCLTGKTITDLAVLVQAGGSETTQLLRVASSIVHPKFNPDVYDYDIALLRMETVIRFNRTCPVCLPFKFRGDGLAGAKVTALGWGTQSMDGPTPDPQKVDLVVLDQSSCRSQISSLTDRQLCTDTPEKDPCQDDSGGPLLYSESTTGRFYNMGIISYGITCSSLRPGVNTRVTELLNWITERTPDVDYCVQ